MRKIVSVVIAAMIGISTIAIQGGVAKAAAVPNYAKILNTYGKIFDNVGAALAESEILDKNKLGTAAEEFNSITVDNKMKQNNILGQSPNLISIQQARSLGYYIPDNYPESTVPTLNFQYVDKVMEACYEKKLNMRGPALIGNEQTPDWYFKNGYIKDAGDVNQDVMNKRMEFLIKSYINHVHSSKFRSVIYAWDVVDGYLQADMQGNLGWQRIYGKNLRSQAPFVKQAFKYAYEALEAKGLIGKVKLFYSDYDTYRRVYDVVNLINYINKDKKTCAGVAMKSHLSTDFPQAGYYKAAMDVFRKEGFEIQITALDVGCKDESVQAKYYYDLMRAILQEKKAGANISAVIWSGISDKTSLYSNEKPLLFLDYNVKKPAYNSVVQAFFDEGFKMEDVSYKPTPTPGFPPNPVPTDKIDDGWYYIKNVYAQKYLTVGGNGSKGEGVTLVQMFRAKGQMWYLKNISDDSFILESGAGDFELYAPNIGANEGANIEIFNSYGLGAERFMIKRNSEGSCAILTRGSDGTKALDNHELGTENGTKVSEWNYNGSDGQKWILEPTDDWLR